MKDTVNVIQTNLPTAATLYQAEEYQSVTNSLVVRSLAHEGHTCWVCSSRQHVNIYRRHLLHSVKPSVQLIQLGCAIYIFAVSRRCNEAKRKPCQRAAALPLPSTADSDWPVQRFGVLGSLVTCSVRFSKCILLNSHNEVLSLLTLNASQFSNHSPSLNSLVKRHNYVLSSCTGLVLPRHATQLAFTPTRDFLGNIPNKSQ